MFFKTKVTFLSSNNVSCSNSVNNGNKKNRQVGRAEEEEAKEKERERTVKVACKRQEKYRVTVVLPAMAYFVPRYASQIRTVFNNNGLKTYSLRETTQVHRKLP